MSLEKALEFKKEVYISIFKASLTLIIIILSATVSVLYQKGLSAIPWVAMGVAGTTLTVIISIWSAIKVFELAEQLERRK
ncbi:MAG: hypothetical protein DSY35_05535 [Desulfurobacterium sp.]|nr:MAG: hypothetical protein DSY35_05535 [Desulfurobacterium sp.]